MTSIPLSAVIRRLLTLTLLASVAIAQVPKALLGHWIGTSPNHRGEKLEIGPDEIVIAGKRLPYRSHGPVAIVIGGENGQRAEFEIQGEVLTFTLEGEPATYQRASSPADVSKTKSPATGAAKKAPDDREVNPLQKPLARDLFARAFRGQDIALELEGSAADGYRGKLVFQGAAYRAEATARGKDLAGRFQSGATWFEFKASLQGDHLKLESGGTSYDLEGSALPAAAPENPLEKPRGAIPVAELDGVFAGSTKRYEHPRGWFGFDMPEGWSVHQESATGMLLNPGLTATDTLDAIVGLMWGRLETADQNVPVAKIITQRVPLLRQALATQGLTVGEPEGEVKTYRCKDVPGAVVVFRGQNPQGKAFGVWFGGIVKRDGWIAVSCVVLDGKESTYLPKWKRIFTTLEPRPPERNPKLEAALVGRSFSSSQYGRRTDSAHHASYTFDAGGVVTRRLITNVITKPDKPGIGADSETGGRYEVCGDVLYLYFEPGQEVGQVVVQAGEVSCIQIGTAKYQ